LPRRRCGSCAAAGSRPPRPDRRPARPGGELLEVLTRAAPGPEPGVGATGAGLALLGGLALTALGVAALAIGGAALVVVPALWILRDGRLAPAPG